MYSVLADAVLVVHLLCILWIVFGAVFTRRRPLLRWVHIASVVWGVLIELLPWTCPLTWAENWLKAKACLRRTRAGSCCIISTHWFTRTYPWSTYRCGCRRLPFQFRDLCFPPPTARACGLVGNNKFQMSRMLTWFKLSDSPSKKKDAGGVSLALFFVF